MIDILIHYSLFFTFLLGVWFLLQPLFVPVVDRMQFRMKRSLQRDIQDTNKFIQDIADFLELAINKNSVKAVYTFLLIMFLSWILVFLGLIGNGFRLYMAFIWSLITPFLIFIYLNFKGYTNRVSISYEGLIFVTELVNNYRIFHHNLHEAIDQTINSIGDKAPLTRKMLLNMSYRIRESQNEEEIQKVLDQMVFLNDTSWSKQLANLFKIGLTKGEDITQGLLDVAVDLGELDKMSEKKKQLNLEGNMMLKGLLPLMVGAGFYFIFSVADFTIVKYLSYQLKHPIGFRFLLITVFSILVSSVLYMFFSRSKNDF